MNIEHNKIISNKRDWFFSYYFIGYYYKMYFLAKVQNGVELVSNFKKIGLKMAVLINYLNQHDIKFVNDTKEICGDGLYCIRNGLNNYKVYEYKKHDDGYILSGSMSQTFCYSLEFVYYFIKPDQMGEVCKGLELKVC